MSRHKAEIDAAEVQRLAEVGCNDVEIGYVFNVHSGTIARRFAKELEKGRGNLRKKLRKKQYDVAMKGNVAMLIWLGKQYMGQSDHSELEISGKKEKPLEVFNHTAVVAAIAGRPAGDHRQPGAAEASVDGTTVG